MVIRKHDKHSTQITVICTVLLQIMVKLRWFWGRDRRTPESYSQSSSFPTPVVTEGNIRTMICTRTFH